MSLDYSKSYVNITDGTVGGTINPGDILEIRSTFVVRGGDRTLQVTNIRYFDTLKANAGLRYTNQISTRTNEGKVVNTFTDATGDDAGWAIKPAVGDTTIQINIGPGATSNSLTGGGTLESDSRPSVFGGTCIIMATYRVTVTGEYEKKINFGGGAFRYNINGQDFTITFPRDSLIVYPTLDACSDAVSPENLIGSANNGTFGTLPMGSMPTAALQNAGPASFNTSYIYSDFSTGAPQDYYYGITNNTSGLNTIDQTFAKGSGTGNPRVFSHWDITGDHTGATDLSKGNPPCDVTKVVSATNPCGYLLAINSAYRTDKVFEYTASGVCTDTYYEVSAWFKNICYRCGCDSVGRGSGGGSYIPTAPGDSSGVRPNVTMQIDGINYYSTGELIYQGLGGTQSGSDTLNKWIRRSFVFKTSPTQTSFTITFKNNAPGGGGNDWAIDDIGLRTCYPDMIYAPTNPIVFIGNSLTITDTVRSYFNNYTYYKWQKAPGATPTVFSDIPGASGNAINVYKPLINQYEFVISYTIPGTATQPANSGDVYRMVVASNVANLNSGCNFVPTISFTLLPADAPCEFTAVNYAVAPKNGVINWNKLNWSLGHVPTCCESAYITYPGDNAVTDSIGVYITNDICLINLTFVNVSTKGNQVFRTVLHPGYNMLMRGDVRMGATAPFATDSTLFIAKGANTITVNGNTVIGYNGDPGTSIIGSAPGTNAYINYVLKGDSLTFNTKAFTNHKFASFTMDPTSGSAVLVNNVDAVTYPFAVSFDSLYIGKTTPKTVTLAGTGSNSFLNDNNGALVVSTGSTFIMPANYTLNAKDFVTAGVFKSRVVLQPNSTLRIGGTLGGTTGSNFPANYLAYTMDPTSTVIFNGAAQTIPGTSNNVNLYGHITLTGTGLKTGTSSDINLAGNLYRTSGGHTFDGNSGRVTFVSSVRAQRYYTDAGATPMNFYNLTNNNTFSAGLSIDSTIGIVNELELKPSSTTTLNTGNIIMRSSAARTSHITDLGVTIPTIVYNTTYRFVIERYLYGQKSWRFLSTPVQLNASDATTPTVANAWREGSSPLTSTGYGTAITGPTGANAELDYYTQRGSMKYFTDASNTFIELSNTTSTRIANTQGYMVFVRGDRGAVNSPSGPGSATTLRMSGKIRTGSQTFPVLATKYQSIGNPYASQISFAGLVRTNVPTAFVVWNPILSGLYGVGGYENYSLVSGNYRLNGLAAGKIRNTIESGEAFFVQNNSPTLAGSVVINESSKGLSSSLVSRNSDSLGNGPEYPTLDISLFEKDNLGTYILVDGVSASFDDAFSNEFDNDDVTKFLNSYDNLFIKSNNKNLVVEKRQKLSATDTIRLGINGTRTADYRFHIDPYIIENSGLVGYLVDKFTNTQSLISLSGNTEYNFDITNDAVSRVDDRFMIVFAPAVVLPVTLTSITAVRNTDKTVTVKWTAENESALRGYEVENSEDGINFSKIGNSDARNSGLSASYSFVHSKASAKINYYRIRSREQNNDSKLSNIARAEAIQLAGILSVSPNPVQGKLMNVSLKIAAGKYDLKMYDEAGKLVLRSAITTSGTQSNQPIDLKHLSAGNYKLVISDGKNIYTTSVVVQ